jgi:hypothetical protein
MPLSANTLIHFTWEKDSLKGILQGDFRISYCKETIQFDVSPTVVYVPMVSFCNIPLSQIKEHMFKYGNYGIGMKKEWVNEQKMNPVLYVARNSSLASSYMGAVREFFSDPTWKPNVNTGHMKLIDIIRYIKNYEADLIREGKITENYRFSDEREWRYAPPFSDDYPFFLHEKAFNENGGKSVFNERISNLRLKFTPNDIRYIIIEKESEIDEFIKYLRSVKGMNYSDMDVERLTTRILTSEQIFTDF